MRMSLSFSNRMERPVGNSPGPDKTFSSTTGAQATVLPAESHTVIPSRTSSVPSVFIFLSCFLEFQVYRSAFCRPCGRSCSGILISVPVPGTLGDSEIINDSHLSQCISGDASMVESAPDSLSATPGKSFPSFIALQVSPSGCIFSRAVSCYAAIF